jgi:hypothetical protein
MKAMTKIHNNGGGDKRANLLETVIRVPHILEQIRGCHPLRPRQPQLNPQKAIEARILDGRNAMPLSTLRPAKIGADTVQHTQHQTPHTETHAARHRVGEKAAAARIQERNQPTADYHRKVNPSAEPTEQGLGPLVEPRPAVSLFTRIP